MTSNGENMQCPGCGTPMEVRSEPDLTTNVCPHCRGVFLDKGELNSLAVGLPGNIEFSSLDRVAEREGSGEGIRICARCGSSMAKVFLLSHTDILFDYCGGCESFFLDSQEVDELNQVLAHLADDELVSEYREYHDGSLVRLDYLDEVRFYAYPGGLETHPVPVYFARISVFFGKPLGLGLHIHSQAWFDKVLKTLGLFKREDISVGDEIIDRSFHVQAKAKESATAVLKNDEVQSALKSMASFTDEVFGRKGIFEVLDDRVLYTAGPLAERVSYTLPNDSKGVLACMLKVAKAISKVG